MLLSWHCIGVFNDSFSGGSQRLQLPFCHLVRSLEPGIFTYIYVQIWGFLMRPSDTSSDAETGLFLHSPFDFCYATVREYLGHAQLSSLVPEAQSMQQMQLIEDSLLSGFTDLVTIIIFLQFLGRTISSSWESTIWGNPVAGTWSSFLCGIYVSKSDRLLFQHGFSRLTKAVACFRTMMFRQ